MRDPARRTSRLRLECLEDRTVPSTFTVLTSADNGSDLAPVAGSLREAILLANAHPNSNVELIARDRIVFAIPGVGPHTIQPLSELPSITDPVVLDATTQPGFAGTPIIELDGELAGNANGLTLTAGQTTVRGFVINRFAGNGTVTDIFISGQGGNAIQGNYLGTNLAGDAVFPANAQAVYGLVVFGTAANVIGTNGDGINDDAEGNVIAGMVSAGILLQNGAANNVIAGNRIGTNAAGDAALGNGRFGIFFLGAGGKRFRDGRNCGMLQRNDRPLKSNLQNFIHGLYEVDRQTREDLLRDIRQVLFIILRKQHGTQAHSVSGQQLFFDAADGQHFAAEGDFSGHGDVPAHGILRERADD